MILAILQARMSSSRLPGKVLAEVEGMPMIGRQVERLLRCRRIDRLVVATSQEAEDDALARYCEEDLGLGVWRGELADVLGRFQGAARKFGPAEHVVRLTADCPLCDPGVVDAVVDLHLAGGFDYTSNTPAHRTFPHGLDAEIMRAGVLQTACLEAEEAYEREHVTAFIYRRPDRFQLGFLSQETDLSQLRWTVDYPADLAFVREVYRVLLPTRPAFSMEDVLALPVRSAPLP